MIEMFLNFFKITGRLIITSNHCRCMRFAVKTKTLFNVSNMTQWCPRLACEIRSIVCEIWSIASEIWSIDWLLCNNRNMMSSLAVSFYLWHKMTHRLARCITVRKVVVNSTTTELPLLLQLHNPTWGYFIFLTSEKGLHDSKYVGMCLSPSHMHYRENYTPQRKDHQHMISCTITF